MTFESKISSHLRIRSQKKEDSTGITTRVFSPQETISKMMPVCNRIGVTRIADITHLDRLYLPNYSITLPGTDDSIWVYGGKGQTKSHAKASAIMEALERYTSLSTNRNKTYVRGSHFELSKSYRKVLHPCEVMEPTEELYDDKNSIMDFVSGYDLINNEEVLVPAALSFSAYSAKPPTVSAFPYSHTNGLASGNVLEEAICHALCEVIERDAVSIADLCSSSIPYTLLKNMFNALLESNRVRNSVTRSIDQRFVDDSTIFQEVDTSEVMAIEPLGKITKRFSECGIPLLIKDITQSDIGIPTFVASCAEWVTCDFGYFAKGYGSHPDSRIALIRAITEVSQTRASNIQGARDDLKKIRYLQEDNIVERKWQFICESDNSISNKRAVMFSKIRTYSNKDLLDDIKLILKRIKKAGLKRAIIVDLTNPQIGVPVVRAIVPGLETFEIQKLFLKQGIQIGNRAKYRFRM